MGGCRYLDDPGWLDLCCLALFCSVFSPWPPSGGCLSVLIYSLDLAMSVLLLARLLTFLLCIYLGLFFPIFYVLFFFSSPRLGCLTRVYLWRRRVRGWVLWRLETLRFGTFLTTHLAHFFDMETNGFQNFSGSRGSTLPFACSYLYCVGRLRLCCCRCMLS